MSIKDQWCGEPKMVELDFTTPKYRTTDPDTSRAAWLDNLPRAGTQRRRIYDCIAYMAHGAICAEVVEATGIKWNSASTRISELLASGAVRDTGRRRMGPDGSYQRVVEVTHGRP